MTQFIVLLCLLWGLSGLLVGTAAEAAPFCRTYQDHTICILSIKRSAKHYWEYRAAVSVDGVNRPVEIYNCRDRRRFRKNAPPVPFSEDEAGTLICQILQK